MENVYTPGILAIEADGVDALILGGEILGNSSTIAELGRRIRTGFIAC